MTTASVEDASALGVPALTIVEPPTRTVGHRVARLARSVRTTRVPLLVAADSAALGLALITGQLAIGTTWERAGQAAAYIPIYLLAFGAYGLYRRGGRRLIGSSFPDLPNLAHGLAAGSLVAFLTGGFLHRNAGLAAPGALTTVVTTATAFLAVVTARMLARRADLARFGRPKVLIVGSGLVAGRLAERIRATGAMEVVGCIDDEEAGLPRIDMNIRRLGNLAELQRLVETHDIDRLVVAFSPVNESRLAAQLRELSDVLQISVVPRMFDLLTVRSHVDEVSGLPMVDVAPASLGPLARLAKRSMDLVGALLMLLVLSPVLIAVALAIKLDSRGPVLFRQERTGRGGRPFPICKFRTMHFEAEDLRLQLGECNEVDGPLFKLQADPRVTRVGSWLRRTSTDELPQLLNVVTGQMSLVGPRPFVTAESAEIDGWAGRRFEVRPGMTGLWQVSGRSDLPFDELRRLDYSYVASWSLWWDLRILWHTPSAVLRRTGAY